MRTERTTITLPKGLRDQAHASRINISALAADAVSKRLKKRTRLVEKESSLG
ncbi:MAG: type II toxin-antitoxin system CcdA family antitoxin [Methanoregula sp.]